MDKYSKRFLWLATQMLSDCELDDAGEQAELREIVRRLRAMAVGIADEMSCERIGHEIREMRHGRPPHKAASR